MSSLQERWITKEHTWIVIDGEEAIIGITPFAAEQLGDVVYVDLPEVGTAIVAGQAFGTVESVKSLSDLFAPISGSVIAKNRLLKDEPEKVNEDPLQQAWMIRVAPSLPQQTMEWLTEEQYQAFLANA